MGKFTIPTTAVGKAIVKGSLGLTAVDGAYRIAKTGLAANKEIKDQHSLSRNETHDNLIKAKHADSVKKQAAATALLKSKEKKNLRPTVKPGGQGSRNFNQSKWD